MKNAFRNVIDFSTSRWVAFEPYAFAVLLAINLIPVLGVEYFFTGDGPAHIYNAHIIVQLLFEESPAVADFFDLRHGLIPNLGGHTLLTFFRAWLPAAWAEKIVYALCILLLPLGFRNALRKLKPEAVTWSLMIFPLVHNFCFYIGFQSFCIGLGLLFFSIGAYFSIESSAKPIRYLRFGALLFLTAYFHLFAAVLVMMVLAVQVLISHFRNRQNQFRKPFWAGVFTLPTVVFCGVFILGNSSDAFSWNQAEMTDQLKSIWEGVAIITLDMHEKKASIPFNIMLAMGLLLGIYHRIRYRGLGAWDFSLFTAGLCLILYFILPDEMASGGFVSMRLLLSFLLFLALWVVLTLRKSGFALLLMLGLIVQNSVVVAYHYREAKKLSDDVVQMVAVVPHIPEGSVVVPINYSPHWLQYNLGLYPGAESPLIILDNYEASKSHFPVQWVDGQFPGDRLGNFTTSNAPLFKLEPFEGETGHRVDAVIRWKYHPGINDSLTLQTNALLDSAFTQVDIPSAKDIELHLRKAR